MPSYDKELKNARKSIDKIDEELLELLTERIRIVQEIVHAKVKNKLPVYIPEREIEKSNSFKAAAEAKGLDPAWAEDFLRLIMSSSRSKQSQHTFPIATEMPKHILYIGGKGGMGTLYSRITAQTGHHVYCIDKENWHELEALVHVLDLVIITVPINITEQIIKQLKGRLSSRTILADFTSNKSGPIRCMLENHGGPVVGLHPMHGPDVENLSKQLMVVCPARKAEKADWFIKQCELWGMRIVHADPQKHDHVMNLVQGLRHFVALLHGSFMEHYDLNPTDMLDYSSPIYRAELMMTGRIFAQNAELYADIVFASNERRTSLLKFLEHHKNLAEIVKNNDREGFIREFEGVTKFFGNFTAQALHESGYLVNRLADRFT